MNSIWNKNLNLFKIRFPSLYNIYAPKLNLVNSLSFFDFYDFQEAKNKEITASENQIKLHSFYNPSREALNSVSIQEIKNRKTTVFLGLGLGYQLLEWAKLYGSTEKKLVIIEPEPAYLFVSFFIIDWTEIFKIKNLIIALNCPLENLTSLLENPEKINTGNEGLSASYIFDFIPFTKHDENYFNSVRQLIKRNLTKNDINKATLKKFGRLWCKNSLKNLEQYEKLKFINVYENKTNLPFLIIGAGPSLKKIIPFLPELQKRMITVCVETSLRILQKNGFEPDFVILSDPQYWAFRHIAGLKSEKTTLITEITAWNSVFNLKFKNKMLMSSQFPVGQYFEKKAAINPGNLGTGGSVASSCFNFAYFCGSRQIYYCGLDLGFPGKETHIKGSEAEQNFHSKSTRLNSTEKNNITIISDANLKEEVDFSGNKITTDSRMKMFAWWFESRIASLQDVKVFSLCKESLKIPGVMIEKIENALNLNEIQNEKKDFLQLSDTYKNCIDSPSFEKLKASFPDKAFLEENPFLTEYLK